MASPFKGPRHESWLRSDTTIFAAVFMVVLITTAIADYLNGPADPPAYLLAALGAASTALFGAVSSDKSKREKEVRKTAERAESKADDALTRSDSSIDSALARVLAIQERQLVTERAALQAMRDAIDVKESSGIPVLPETYAAVGQLEHQITELEADIHRRRKEVEAAGQVQRESRSRVEAKVDKLAEFAAREHPHDAHMLPKPSGEIPQATEGGEG